MRQIAIGALALVMGVVGCSSSDSAGSGNGPGGGTVELGQPCIETSDCKVPAGQEVACGCTPASATHVCAQLLEPGSPCGSGNFQVACRSDSYCVSHTANGSDALCEAYLKLGDDCTGLGRCGPGTTCDGGKCAAAHAIGGSCDGFEPQPCVSGAACDFASSTCVAVKNEGEVCTSSSECAPGATCSALNGADATCVSPKAAGQPCSNYFDCADGLDCVQNEAGTQTCERQSQPTGCGIP